MAGDTELQDQAEWHNDLGVLFVHGIGDQQQNSTLAKFGGSLQRWLRRSLDPDPATAPLQQTAQDQIAPKPAVEVTTVAHHTADGDDPAHARLLVGRPGDPEERRQRWLLAEGWWAAEVSPPTFKAFSRWVLPMLPWMAAEYAVAAARRPEGQRGEPSPNVRTEDQDQNRFEKALESLSLAGLLWLLSPVLAVLAMLACVLLALLQRVPVIGKRVNAFNANFIKGVGDAYLFAYDALARGAMLQRIRRNLDWLTAEERRCRKVVIVAHSQGAALCHDLLRSGAIGPERPVDLLVTVGSGVRRLDGFRQLHDNAKLRSLGWTSILGLLSMVTGTILVLGSLGIAGAAGLWARLGGLAVLAGCLVAGPTPSFWRPLGLALAALGAASLAAAGASAGGSAGARLIAGAGLMALGVWLYWRAATRALEQIDQVSRLALPYEAVCRWVDIYSTADPVPNGPLRTWPWRKQDGKEEPPLPRPLPPPAVHPTAHCVYNLRSVQADHSYYPDNSDEFMSLLASELALESELPGTPLVEADRLNQARARRRWRTSCRSNARNLLLVAGLLSAVGITLRLGGGRGWAGLGSDAGVAPAPPYGALGQLARWAQDWLAKLPLAGGQVARISLPSFAGILLAAVAVMVAGWLLGRLWSVWDTNDTDRFFLRAETLGAWRTHWPAWAFLGLTAVLVTGSIAAVATYGGRSWITLAPLAAGLLFAAALTWVRWRTCLGARGTLPRPGPLAGSGI